MSRESRRGRYSTPCISCRHIVRTRRILWPTLGHREASACLHINSLPSPMSSGLLTVWPRRLMLHEDRDALLRKALAMKIAVCASTVPFVAGGASNMVEWLGQTLEE